MIGPKKSFSPRSRWRNRGWNGRLNAAVSYDFCDRSQTACRAFDKKKKTNKTIHGKTKSEFGEERFADAMFKYSRDRDRFVPDILREYSFFSVYSSSPNPQCVCSYGCDEPIVSKQARPEFIRIPRWLGFRRILAAKLDRQQLQFSIIFSLVNFLSQKCARSFAVAYLQFSLSGR